MLDVWVYNGWVYDLSEWIFKYFGGVFFIGWIKNCDIIVIVKFYYCDLVIVE